MDKEMLLKAYLEEVEKRCDAATKGPWISFVEGRDHISGDSVIVRGINGSEEDLYLLGATIADQDFIEHVRQDVPTLIAEIKQLRQRLNIE